jgi:hypothetical protein
VIGDPCSWGEQEVSEFVLRLITVFLLFFVLLLNPSIGPSQIKEALRSII